MTQSNEVSDVHEVDVVVVGLGPGGEATATGLAKAGLEVVAVEKHLVGVDAVLADVMDNDNWFDDPEADEVTSEGGVLTV